MDKKRKEEKLNGNVADDATEKLTQKGYTNKYYNITAHRVVILIYMILTIVFLFLFVPFIVALINWLLSEFGWSESVEFLNSKLLPDFLGGFMGIIIGYVLESTYLRRLKILRQYEAIRTLLVDELDELSKDLTEIIPNKNESEKKGDQYTSLNTEEEYSQTECEILRYIKFHTPVINSVVNSCEYANILYNLPRYSFNSKNKGNILLKVQNINSLLLQNDFDEQNARENKVLSETNPNERYKEIKKEIEEIMVCLKP